MFFPKVVLEELMRRSLRASPFTNLFLTPQWWVAGGKMRVLEGFSLLEVCFYIQNGLILKTFAFVYHST